MIALLEQLDMLLWSVFFMVPTGRGSALDLISAEEFEQVFEKLYETSRRVSFDIKSNSHDGESSEPDPVNGEDTERYTREDTTVAGVTVPRGELVFAVLASANRDEQQFEDADRLDLGREPNPHAAFGFGIHYCLGASLACLEGQIAIATLLRRIPNLKVAIPFNALLWRRGLVLRGLESLPVTLTRNSGKSTGRRM